jgi:hypothetical protein
MMTSGSTTNGARLASGGAPRHHFGQPHLPSSTSSIISPIRVARRPSSSSRSYSREIAMVSSARPSVVV